MSALNTSRVVPMLQPSIVSSAQCSVVYASYEATYRVNLWSTLYAENFTITDPWILMGDFNAVTNASEKRGLSDVGYASNKFTGCNNQERLNCIWMRQEKVLINGLAAAKFSKLKVIHLPRFQSDHCPLLITFSNRECVQSFFSFNLA